MTSSDDAHKLFVAGLSDSATEEVLRDLFAEANIPVVELSLPRDRMTGRPRGFAFIRLESPSDVERALAELNGHLVGGSSISVRRFNAEPPTRGERPERGAPRPPMQDTSDRTLYIGNLPYDTTQEEVEGLLRDAGAESVVRVHLPVDPEGRRRGFGFITMGTSDAAKAAVDQLRGAALRSRPLVVNVALPKGAPGAGGARPDRPFGGPPGGPPPGAVGAAPGNRFGPPAKPGGQRPDYGRKKKGEGEGGPRGGTRASKRDNDTRWNPGGSGDDD